jgi:peptidoglycan-N-acetylglucosamine deacetylase
MGYSVARGCHGAFAAPERRCAEPPPPIKGLPQADAMKLLPSKNTLIGFLPDSLATTRESTRERVAYLTFDDGPDPDYTPRVLDLLGEHGARASFFLIGQRIEKHPEVVERIVAEGHLIGNHSYSHPHFDRLALDAQLGEIERTDGLLGQFDRRTRHRFRTPRGVVPFGLLWHFARIRRRITYWSRDSLDYQDRSVDDLVGRLRQDSVRNGEVVLMHDDSDRAGNVLKTMLPEWKAQGFSMDALPEEAA